MLLSLGGKLDLCIIYKKINLKGIDRTNWIFLKLITLIFLTSNISARNSTKPNNVPNMSIVVSFGIHPSILIFSIACISKYYPRVIIKLWLRTVCNDVENKNVYIFKSVFSMRIFFKLL